MLLVYFSLYTRTITVSFARTVTNWHASIGTWYCVKVSDLLLWMQVTGHWLKCSFSVQFVGCQLGVFFCQSGHAARPAGQHQRLCVITRCLPEWLSLPRWQREQTCQVAGVRGARYKKLLNCQWHGLYTDSRRPTTFRFLFNTGLIFRFSFRLGWITHNPRDESLEISVVNFLQTGCGNCCHFCQTNSIRTRKKIHIFHTVNISARIVQKQLGRGRAP